MKKEFGHVCPMTDYQQVILSLDQDTVFFPYLVN